ncbi:ATP-binding protein [Eubacterium oxidoreducens]|uniref:Uncharacterized protein n=1 Tax=Eubacterium oxidoreducens TaxID=1732 RepID=A0A1G6ANU0_EUBOX|nr:ATP-binding protein [Eubacterium oxidoreducens]SDB10104.1 hypothetical protein SAMN02910417_00787 [Eubacterium oxidoreducens]
MKLITKFVIFKEFKHGDVLENFCTLMDEGCENHEALFYESFHQLIELASSYGFEGNIWHNYLAFLIANNENSFSLACEGKGKVEGSINPLAIHDFEIFRELFAFDFSTKGFPKEFVAVMEHYENVNDNSKVFNKRIRDRIVQLSKDLPKSKDEIEFMEYVTEFYKRFGVGELGLHKAFRITRVDDRPVITPISNIAHVSLDDLVGYEIPKKKLIANTESFVKGYSANNCLLYGDAGTGKSSSIKAIVNQYYDQGLRLIEVYKHQFKDLNEVIAQIKNRNYKFIIYMDDLSFEEFEIEYKYLKAVIEGGLEKKPDNVLIYATSNRRHLVREKFSDKEERRDDLHASDTVQEKLSLVSRFGVQIFFCAPDKKEFKQIVEVLAQKHGITMDTQLLLEEANKWELSHGGLSGRTAQQFINHVLGSCEER